VTVPNYVRQIQIRFGCYQFGQNPNRALLFVRVKSWEIIADNLKKCGWNWGCVSAVDSAWRTIWISDAHRGNGKRFVVNAVKGRRRFWNWNRRFDQAERPENCAAREITLDNRQGSSKSLLDYVIRQFHLIFSTAE